MTPSVAKTLRGHDPFTTSLPLAKTQALLSRICCLQAAQNDVVLETKPRAFLGYVHAKPVIDQHQGSTISLSSGRRIKDVLDPVQGS